MKPGLKVAFGLVFVIFACAQPTAPGTYRVAGLEVIGLDPETEQRVVRTVNVKRGDVVSADRLRTVADELRKVDPRLAFSSIQRPGEQAPNERILVVRMSSALDPGNIPENPVRVDRDTQMRNFRAPCPFILRQRVKRESGAKS